MFIDVYNLKISDSMVIINRPTPSDMKIANLYKKFYKKKRKCLFRSSKTHDVHHCTDLRSRIERRFRFH